MDDMASALGNILNNPQAMQQIMSLASQLGLGAPSGESPPPAPAAAPPPTAPPPPPQPFSFAPQQPQPDPVSSLLGNIDMGTIAKISQILGTLNTHDQNVDLLMALKPHFGEKRRKKVDDAIRIMQLVKVLPLLKEAGIFGNLFGGGDADA